MQNERKEAEQKKESLNLKFETAETKAANAEKRAQDSEVQAKFLLKTLTQSETMKDEATKKAEEFKEIAATAIKRVKELDSNIQEEREKRLCSRKGTKTLILNQ